METNIPIYRAKKIDSDEYVIGWYSSPIIIEGKLYLSITNQDGEHRIDTTTLSIHFPDMIDSQGNAIFASLQKNGKGGDIFKYNSLTAYRELDNQQKTVVFHQGRYCILIGKNYHSLFALQGKAIGIQE